MYTMKIPVLSTGHLDADTVKVLSEQGKNNPWCICAEFDYGYFLWIGDISEPVSPAPNCLHAIKAWMEKNFGGGWVCLDSDGDVIDGLEFYEW